MLQEHHAAADQLIGEIYTGEAPWSAVGAAVERKRAAVFASVRGDHAASAALYALAYHPVLLPFLSSIEPVLPFRGARPGNTALDAILLVALHQGDWQRPLETWVAPEEDRFFPVLTRLLDHLFGNWEAPGFLDQAWLQGLSEEARLWQACYLCVRVGKRLRDIHLPIQLTARGRHYFLQAPPSLPLACAARWGQLQALGAEPRLIDAVLETRLSDVLPQEAFWATVVQFFVQHPELPPGQIGPIVDFLWDRRCGPDASEPTLSMKGRTPAALLERVTAWHASLGSLDKGHHRRWRSLGLPPFSLEEREASGAILSWEIVELLDTNALQQEGSELRHCVRTYSVGCIKGERSLFSLRLLASDSRTRRRMLTVEVDRSRRTIVQVRGRANTLPREHRPGSRLGRSGALVRQWARERNLGISCRF